jgi:VWFA-related protein
MRVLRTIAAVWLAAGAGAVATNGAHQQSPQPFRTGVDTVQVDVSVVDGDGRPVTDLRTSDFEVREDSVHQDVQLAFLATNDRSILTANGPAAPGASPAGATVGADASSIPRRELPQRVFVFLFDLAHLSPAGFTRSRTALESFLKDGLTPLDVAGIVAGGQMLGNKLDTDKGALLKALAGIGGPNVSRYNLMRTFPRILDEAEATHIARNDQKTLDVVVRRACAERPGECQGPGGDEAIRIDADSKSRQIATDAAKDSQATIASFQALASGLGRLPGPKHVVVFSDGFYAEEFQSRLEQVVGSAAANGVRFSALDTRGLGGDPRMQNLASGEQPLTTPGDLSNVGLDANIDVLSNLAIDTGGELVRNHNTLRPVLERIARETGTYYVLGYSPVRPFDGTFRKIDVRVKRPGVTVHARRGYIATRRAVESAPPRPADPIAAPPSPPASASIDPASPADGLAVRVRPGATDRAAALVGAAAGGTGANADPRVRLAREGWDYYSKGDVERARENLIKATAKGGQAWEFYVLGLSELALQHVDAAINAWREVRAQRADFEPVYFDLANAYIRMNQTADALGVLRDAARRWPTDAEPHNAIGVVLVRRDNLDDAIASFQQATTLAPEDGLGFYNLGRTYHLRYLRILRSVQGASVYAARTLADREKQRAIDAYTRAIAIGGQFGKDAKAALDLLAWK